MIYLQLFFEFFKIGLFSLGGGLATLPFLTKLAETKGWYTVNELTNMLAVSESTPGPIGINMATYVGFHISGVLGALIAVFSIVLPSYVIIVTISYFLDKFSGNSYLESVFKVVRPVVTALIVTAFLPILNTSLFNGTFNVVKIVLFFVIFLLVFKFKKHPIVYIVFGGILGLILKIN